MTSPRPYGAALCWAALLSVGAAGIEIAGALGQPPEPTFLFAALLVCAAIQAAAGLLVLALPARNLLAGAGAVNAAGLCVWVVVHTRGLRIGMTLWRPETLGVPDFYVPAMQLVAGLLCVSLWARTFTGAPGARSLLARFAPLLIAVIGVLGVAVSYIRNPGATVVAFVNFVMIAGLPASLVVVLVIEAGLAVALVRMAGPRNIRKMLTPLPALLVAVPLTWAGAGSAATRAWLPDSPLVAPAAGQTASVAYCSPGGSPLAMDLSMPTANARQPAPALVYVHGGAGFLGSRGFSGDQEGTYFRQLRDELVADGFVVGSIDYGFIPLHSLTEVVEDTGCAIRFLRAYSTELGIDTNHVGVFGDSEGRYVAAMLGTAGAQDGLDVGQYLDQSSSVQAAVDMWGFSDLTDFSGSPSWIASISQASRSTGRPPRTLSPLYRVQPGDPPFLIIHGVDDWFIAPHHSEKLAQTLAAAGVPATLVLVQHDGHGIAAATSGEVEQPSPDALVQTVCDFFRHTLGAG
jgi:acetyl esterase/lipase